MVAADPRTPGIEFRLSILDQSDVGGGPAHVRDEGVVVTGKMLGADDARGGTGKNGFHRSLQGRGGIDQGSVTLDSHDRGQDPAAGHQRGDRDDELLDHGDEPGVEQCGQGAPRRIELGTQAVTAGDRKAGRPAQHVAHGDFVGGIANREHRGDGEGRDSAGLLEGPGLHVIEIERRGFFAQGVVTSASLDQGPSGQGTRDILPGAVIRCVTDEDERCRTAPALDDGIGGERGRDRHEGDHACMVAQHRIDGSSDADRQVVPCRQRLRRRERSPGGVKQHGIGVGSAGIDTQHQRQGVVSRTLRRLNYGQNTGRNREAPVTSRGGNG